MKRYALIVCAALGMVLGSGVARADCASFTYSGYQPWWYIFEARLQHWHDHCNALKHYYGALITAKAASLAPHQLLHHRTCPDGPSAPAATSGRPGTWFGLFKPNPGPAPFPVHPFARSPRDFFMMDDP